MSFLKKYYKVIGMIVTVIAMVFVVKKLVTMDVDWSMFTDGKTLLIITICVLVQTGIVFFLSVPWVRFIRILSGVKIPLKSAASVYARSNFMKYVPGNVFQYVGRNRLAADMQISHVDVACSTILEILCCFITPFLLILLLMGRQMIEIFQAYRKNFLVILLAGVVLVVLLLLLCRWKFRQQLQNYFRKYSKLLKKDTLPRLLSVLLLYIFQYVVATAMYAIPACTMFDIPKDQMALFLGTYLFSWVIGYITPGAPGGFGVREAVMMLMCSSFMDTDTITLYAVTMRLVTTLGDILAFVLGLLLQRFCVATEKPAKVVQSETE